MTLSPNLKLPGPDDGDNPDGPGQIQLLIDRLEALRGGYAEIGAMQDWAGRTDPNPSSGCWMITDGRTLLRSAYPDLFGILGTTYTQGNEASTEFRLPNIVRRVVYAPGPGDTVGTTGGAETVTLTEAQMPSHSHGGSTGNESQSHNHTYSGTTGADDRDHQHHFTDPGHDHGGSGGALMVHGGGSTNIASGTQVQGVNTSGSTSTSGTGATVGGRTTTHLHPFSGTTNNAGQSHHHAINADGGGQAHPNLPPYILFYKIIRVK